MRPIESGDVVVVRGQGNGPLMTVSYTNTHEGTTMAYCVWFEVADTSQGRMWTLKEHSFDSRALIRMSQVGNTGVWVPDNMVAESTT